MDTSNDSETTATLKFNILVKQCEDLGKNCNNQHLRSIYKLIKAFFKNVLNSNSCCEFFDYVNLIEIFLKLPENIQLIIVKILSRKPAKYPGKVFNGNEVLLINQNTDDIGKFINIVPKDTISLHFLISNTIEQERNDYYKDITGRFIYRCSVEKLMDVLIEMITNKKLNGADVFNHFYGLLKGVYRVDFSVYKMFSSMALFFYSNEISRLTFLNHNIIDLYLSRNENKLSEPNLKLLERPKFTLFTNVAMLYFGILNSNQIMSGSENFSIRTLDEIMVNYQLLTEDGSFSEFDRMNFQNSTQFILFKCMKCMADNFISILNSDIAKELLEAMIYTDYFIKLPVVLQCRLLLDYCQILRRVSSLRDVPRICRIFYHNLKGIPLYYAINFYKIYKEHKQFHDNRKRVFYDCDFLPVLEVTLEKPPSINVLRPRDLHNSLVNNLKDVTECSKGFTFDINLWNEEGLTYLIVILKSMKHPILFGVACGGLVLGSTFLYLSQNIVQYKVRNLPHYKESFGILMKHEKALSLLGTPIQVGRVDLSDREHNFVGKETSQLRIPISGSLNSGFMNVHAERILSSDDKESGNVTVGLKALNEVKFVTKMIKLETDDQEILLYKKKEL